MKSIWLGAVLMGLVLAGNVRADGESDGDTGPNQEGGQGGNPRSAEVKGPERGAGGNFAGERSAEPKDNSQGGNG